MLRPFAKDPAPRPARDDRGVPALRPPARAVSSPTPPTSAGTRSTPASTVIFEGAQATHARPRPRHLSLRHLLEPDRRRRLRRRRRRARRHRRGLGRRQGLRDAGRRRARSRPSSTTSSAPASASAAASAAPPPAATAAPAGSTSSRCATRCGSTACRRWRSPSSTCSPGSTRCKVAVRYRSSEGALLDELPLPPVGPARRRGRVRGAPRLRGRHRRVPHARPTCRARRATTCDFVAEHGGRADPPGRASARGATR